MNESTLLKAWRHTVWWFATRHVTCDVYTSTLHAETGIGGYNHIITQSRKHDAWG